MFLAPALAAQRSFVLYQAERKLAGDLAQVNRHLEQANLSLRVRAGDPRRKRSIHSRPLCSVAIYARDIATRMGLSEREFSLSTGAAWFTTRQDRPSSRPSGETWSSHTDEQAMEGTLPSQSDSAKVDDYAEIAKIVRHHHERVDGQDIQTAVGEEIPLLSRIISVADATTR